MLRTHGVDTFLDACIQFDLATYVFCFTSVLTFWFLHSLNVGVGCESDK